ncbi:MAG TPA: hypothetical protein VNV65_04750 [Candidatus Solibacter sp.]|nr:hypothetical protein [Candidatus Solibacter sp.]
MILAAPTTTLIAEGLTPEQLREVAVATLALVAFVAVAVLIELRRRRRRRKPEKGASVDLTSGDGRGAVAMYHAPKDAPVPHPAGSPVPELPEPAPAAPSELDPPVEIPPARPDEIGIVIPDFPAGSKPPDSPRR